METYRSHEVKKQYALIVIFTVISIFALLVLFLSPKILNKSETSLYKHYYESTTSSLPSDDGLGCAYIHINDDNTFRCGYDGMNGFWYGTYRIFANKIIFKFESQPSEDFPETLKICNNGEYLWDRSSGKRYYGTDSLLIDRTVFDLDDDGKSEIYCIYGASDDEATSFSLAVYDNDRMLYNEKLAGIDSNVIYNPSFVKRNGVIYVISEKENYEIFKTGEKIEVKPLRLSDMVDTY